MRIKRALAWLLAMILGMTGCLAASAAALSGPDETATAQPAVKEAQDAMVLDEKLQAVWNDEDAYRHIDWDMDMDAVAAAEQGRARSTTVTVQENVWLYGLEMTQLVYRFKDGVMLSTTITARRNNAQAFSYLFFSLFRRYGVPILAEKRMAVWGSVQATITLQRSGEGVTIRYEALR